MEHHHVKVGVQQQDAVGQDGLHVQQHRLGRPVEVVRGQLRLDHNHGVGHRHAEQHHAVVRRLVRRVAKHLHELGPSQVEHELGVERQLGAQVERGGVVRPVVAEPLRQADERAVEPARRVKVLLALHLVARQAGHHHRRRLLVKARDDVGRVGAVHPAPRERGDAAAQLAAVVHVLGDELQEELLLLRAGARRARVVAVLVGRGDLKEQRHRGVHVDARHLPQRGAAQTHLGLRDMRALLLAARGGAQQARHLDVLAGQHLEGGVRGGAHEALLAVLEEQALERVLEHHVVVRVGLHRHAARRQHHVAHLRHAHLVQRARKDVQRVAVSHQLLRHRRVELARARKVGRAVLGQVLV
mmetsp:Transcript_12335/g.30195  ORF Transcript_12335/g.30195 Transcript_12335/m.30195 type:complete len:357 (-) Transcript_12335:1052-2122(-)